MKLLLKEYMLIPLFFCDSVYTILIKASTGLNFLLYITYKLPGDTLKYFLPEIVVVCMEMRSGAAKYRILQETTWLSAHKNGGYVLLGMVHFNLSLHHLLPFFHPITPPPPPPTRGRAVNY
jgi:hypothetical protein